jgi:RNA polymerase sigma-70 factor, ECF subfamily
MAATLTMKFGFFTGRQSVAQESDLCAKYEALIEENWDALWRYAYRTGGNRDEAEDLLSETLLEGFRSYGQFRGDTTFLKWMYRVMTTTRIDMVRRANRRKTESLTVADTEDSEATMTRDILDESTNPENVVVSPMLSEAVQNALAALPEDFRNVVILADMEQMDYADVSRVLKIPLGTVRSRLHRARHQLRDSLAAYVR